MPPPPLPSVAFPSLGCLTLWVEGSPCAAGTPFFPFLLRFFRCLRASHQIVNPSPPDHPAGGTLIPNENFPHGKISRSLKAVYNLIANPDSDFPITRVPPLRCSPMARQTINRRCFSSRAPPSLYKYTLCLQRTPDLVLRPSSVAQARHVLCGGYHSWRRSTGTIWQSKVRPGRHLPAAWSPQ